MANLGYHDAYHFRWRYGLTVIQVLAMHHFQGGKCAICRQPSDGRKLHIDHDHSTKSVRALLCFNCNGMLGQARDNRDVLQNAIKYLDRYGA